MGCELIDALVAGRKGEEHRDPVGVRLMASRAVGTDVGPCERGARVSGGTLWPAVPLKQSAF